MAALNDFALLHDPALGRLFATLPGARAVGGAVRDALLGIAAADVDLAVAMPPDQTMARLAEAGIKTVPTGLAHGTITAVIAGKGYEITSLRHDLSTDGRHAVVAFTDDWRKDAARRDFTINAMSMDAGGHIFDYFGGEADLRAGRVRFVGDAAARVAEDYLRILRFFRFWARFGRDAPDEAAIQAIRAGIAGLAQLSPERVWHELKGLLAAPDPAPALQWMQTTGVLAALLPGGADPARVARLGRAEPLLRFAALADRPLQYAAPLRLSRAESARLAGYCGAIPPPVTAGDDDLRRALDLYLPEHLIGASRLRGDPPAFQDRVRALPRPHFPLLGRDVTALGVPAGRGVGALLADLREWWRAGGCGAGREACLAELVLRARG